jgi:hypothetical protein
MSTERKSMAPRKRVLVYGGSLNLAGLTACLKLDKGMDVFTLNPNDSHARQSLEEFDPATIIFDLTDPSTDLDLALLRNRPHTQLIGVDPSSDDVHVLSNHPVQALSVADLLDVIKKGGINLSV